MVWFAGNDEVHDSWLDEIDGVFTILYYGQRYGREVKSINIKPTNKGKFQLFRSRDMSIQTRLHRPLYEFKDWLEYDSLVYGRGNHVP